MGRQELPDAEALSSVPGPSAEAVAASDPAFASEFDRGLAASGPPAIFLFDREGMLKLEPGWTRDAWARDAGPHPFGWTWTLCRDRATGYVVTALVTSPQLLASHPRLDLRRCRDRAEAQAIVSALGSVPIRREAW